MSIAQIVDTLEQIEKCGGHAGILAGQVLPAARGLAAPVADGVKQALDRCISGGVEMDWISDSEAADLRAALQRERDVLARKLHLTDIDKWGAIQERDELKERAEKEFFRGVIAALGALAPHHQHGDVIHDEIVRSVGKEALYRAAEPEDIAWAALDPEYYAALLAAGKAGV